MEMDLSVFITYVGIVVMFFAFAKVFYWPIKIALKFAANSLLGGILLMLINYLGASFGVFIPVNILNACIVGILGLPGTIMLLILTV